MEIPQLFRETRYGMPTADQILPNRNYLIGYSYLFRQPRWAMQVIDGKAKDVAVDREDCFRTDLRIPEEFRATLADYSGSGYDRGHLVPSADSNSSRLENSETFLISNMAPQHPDLNRKIWRMLEDKVRKTALIQKVVEVYAISGPVFDITKPFSKIGDDVVVPHEFFKTILVEDNRGKFKFYSFLIPNKEMDNQEVNDFATSVNYIEFRTGLKLWDRLKGQTVDKEKKKKRKI
jgi:endonuclease G